LAFVTPEVQVVNNLQGCLGLNLGSLNFNLNEVQWLGMKNKIKVKGAREHNLKNINIEIPKNKLVVFCGVSGSGKSSLAMDTLYAEGQRRYVQSLNTYARQFLGVASKPDVDQIDGLSPAIAIDQKGLSHNPRSTVGTATEVYDYLRLLFAKVGVPNCPSCGRPIERQTPHEVAEQIISRIQDSIAVEGKARFLIMSPVVRSKKGEFTKLFENLAKKGFQQVRIDNQFFFLDEDIVLIRTNRHDISVVVDKINLTQKPKNNKELMKRLIDNIEISFELSDGLAILSLIKDKNFDFPDRPKVFEDRLFSKRFNCPHCQISLPPIRPRLFSFNSPLGACPRCRGLGVVLKPDLDQVSRKKGKKIERRYLTTQSDSLRRHLEKYMIRQVCPECRGTRLKPEPLAVFIEKKNIAQVADLPLDKLAEWLESLKRLVELQRRKVAKIIMSELETRVNFLISVGVNYLTLSREATTLSAGEAQRINLASQLGTGLTGVLYILDEPTVGLHPHDTDRLIKTLKKLRSLGNTVILVEHDESVLRNSDYLIEFGPWAGKNGGKIVFDQTPAELIKNEKSLTGNYLSGRKKVKKMGQVNVDDIDNWLKIIGCKQHNLKNLSVNFPLGAMSVVAGVSGSGKSTLIKDTLYPALKREIYGHFHQQSGEFNSISGIQSLERALIVDQSPIGRSSRSNPATYIGVFDDIRDLFAETKEAKLKGFTKSHFSFNVKEGRCPRCEGRGEIEIKMEFLPDVSIKCEECEGARYKESVLEVDYKGKNIADVLGMTVEEAEEFFSKLPKIKSKLALLSNIGLGYLELGQISPTLSGGEAQRLKLARELVKKKNKPTVYLLDEPTTGLHYADLEKLLAVLRKLVQRGHTIIIIEHNLEIIKQADWVIELGPTGGSEGGYLIAEGTPLDLKNNDDSITGRYL
jgi:excinuclease ABC subunit A